MISYLHTSTNGLLLEWKVVKPLGKEYVLEGRLARFRLSTPSVLLEGCREREVGAGEMAQWL